MEQTFTLAQLQDAVLAERNACAVICEKYATLSLEIWGRSNSDYEDGQANASNNCATSIRARGTK